MKIHPSAIVSQKAQLSEDVEVGPYVIVEDDVVIGRRVKVYSHAQILSHTTIGDDCQIQMGAVLGNIPQIREIKNADGRLIIGQRNIFREYATVHRSSKKENATLIGNDNYFMGFSHIAHDSCIGNHVTICNGTLIAGHVSVEDDAFISGNVTVHQFCRIGKLAMIGGLTRVSKDVPPYMLVKGDSCVWAINSVGLKRANLSLEVRSQIKKAFKLLYKSHLNVKQALEQLQSQNNPPEVAYLINFIQHCERGICDYKAASFWERLRLSNFITKRRRIAAYQLFQLNRNAQEPLAIALVFVLVILLLLGLNRPLKERLQNKYRQVIAKMHCLMP